VATRALRRESYVADEVDTALTYLRDIFLPTFGALCALARLIDGVRQSSCGSAAGSARSRRQSARDPDSLLLAIGARHKRSWPAIWTELTRWAQLSVSSELGGVSADLNALASAAAISTPRAPMNLIGAPSRVFMQGSSATYQKLTGRVPPRPASVGAEPTPHAESLSADLEILERS